jgi:hypothetical protein
MKNAREWRYFRALFYFDLTKYELDCIITLYMTQYRGERIGNISTAYWTSSSTNEILQPEGRFAWPIGG